MSLDEVDCVPSPRMPSIEHLKSLILELPPSCIEFWPLDPRFAVVGTYNLEKTEADQEATEEPEETKENEKKKSQHRNGSLILLRVDNDEVKIIQTLSTPSAILDIHFIARPHQQSIFGVATSTGSIGIYHLIRSEQHDVPELSYGKTMQYFSEDILVTAFLWHPNGSSVGMSLSNGDICLSSINADTARGVFPSENVATHDLEAWTVAFRPDGLGLYSGGDDSVIKFTELAENPEHHFDHTVAAKYGDIRRPPWMDRRLHGAGVTAILPLDDNEEGSLILTGSYDDHIRLIHAPLVGRRTVHAEMNLGGGVWRLKRLDSESTSEGQIPDNVLLLASCMHAGARILNLKRDGQGNWEFEVLAKFEEHKSMNYGSDAQPSLNPKDQRIFITTSFYDRLLCLWRY